MPVVFAELAAEYPPEKVRDPSFCNCGSQRPVYLDSP